MAKEERARKNGVEITKQVWNALFVAINNIEKLEREISEGQEIDRNCIDGTKDMLLDVLRAVPRSTAILWNGHSLIVDKEDMRRALSRMVRAQAPNCTFGGEVSQGEIAKFSTKETVKHANE